MKLFKRKHYKAMHLKAEAVKAEVRAPFDWAADWASKRNDRNLPPEQRFAGEKWYEARKRDVFRFPVGR